MQTETEDSRLAVAVSFDAFGNSSYGVLCQNSQNCKKMFFTTDGF